MLNSDLSCKTLRQISVDLFKNCYLAMILTYFKNLGDSLCIQPRGDSNWLVFLPDSIVKLVLFLFLKRPVVIALDYSTFSTQQDNFCFTSTAGYK